MRELDLDYIGFESGYIPDNAEDLQSIIADVYWEVARLFVENVLEQDDDDLANKIAIHLCEGKTVMEVEQMYKK